ncbi:uncharacterized protein DUF4157 [Fibrobacter succinogenes subsp. elongatus]|uniref:eCIS core domain-containing protein n=1 Tax=Fibrobacter succinogenes TaxID=833 RepID=A0A380RU77_FIBSU|nr:DUF4157 domain-containing protein [Fibrobacter succinogenes]PWJ36849.1 uncharacterized protein DUF4157 [Fibrobacter succinogenes subsp. elongatus]SUQ19098.1 protein of unknown function [Fibrobacter succinogenes]
MNSTYAQKSSPVQKAADSKAASVLDSSAQSESLQRKADMANNAAQRAEAPRPNNTGMPDNLKAGIESLSGFSMDNVRVHYNSSKPATVQALAYTQGTDIHVAPGQEKCLPHEAWHVAQQMAGRVSPTTNINGMPVNDNATLEHEADVMGEKAVQRCDNEQILLQEHSLNLNCNSPLQMTRAAFRNKVLNVENYGAFQRNITSIHARGSLNEGVLWHEIDVNVDSVDVLHFIWRTIMNLFIDYRDESWLGNGVSVFLTVAGVSYEVNFRPNKSDYAKSQGFTSIEGYVEAKKVTKEGHVSSSFMSGRRGDSRFNGYHPSHEKNGKTTDWKKEAICSEIIDARDGDAASKYIAERGRFRCLEQVNSDDEYVCLIGKYGPIYLTPKEIWTSADSCMKIFRENVIEARSVENDVNSLDTQKKDYDYKKKFKEIEKHKGKLGLFVESLLEKCRDKNCDSTKKNIDELKKYVKKLVNASIGNGYPYENEEIYYAITEFPADSNGSSYYFSVNKNDVKNIDRVKNVKKKDKHFICGYSFEIIDLNKAKRFKDGNEELTASFQEIRNESSFFNDG